MPTELDELFARLRTATTPAEIEVLQNGIWQRWLTTGTVALDKELEAGMRALQAEDFTLAIKHFTTIIQLQPNFPEAWNKRATAYYLRGDYRASLADINETLRREPRHFGALWGQYSMLQQLGFLTQALKSVIRLSAICPNTPGLREREHDLRERLEEGE
jgi:tetratricopeptide (TPR) repeat protein